jgi:hypothetical protein
LYPATVTIDRVFSVAYRWGNPGPKTEFGFASGNKRYYGLELPGKPAIEDGMQVTAILEKEGDWNSLQGWLNHTTGELVSPSRANHVLQLLVCAVIGSSVITSLDNAISIVIFLFFSAIALLSGSMLLRAHRANKALAALSRATPAS